MRGRWISLAGAGRRAEASRRDPPEDEGREGGGERRRFRARAQIGMCWASTSGYRSTAEPRAASHEPRAGRPSQARLVGAIPSRIPNHIPGCRLPAAAGSPARPRRLRAVSPAIPGSHARCRGQPPPPAPSRRASTRPCPPPRPAPAMGSSATTHGSSAAASQGDLDARTLPGAKSESVAAFDGTKPKLVAWNVYAEADLLAPPRTPLDDPENPMTWGARRALLLSLVILSSLVATTCSSAAALSYGHVEHKFHVGQEVAILTVAL